MIKDSFCCLAYRIAVSYNPAMKKRGLLIAVAVTKDGEISAKKAVKVWPPAVPIFIKRVQWKSLMKWIIFAMLINAI